jgi:hypothetical protein
MGHISVFDSYRDQVYPHRWHGQLTIDVIAGGIPSDPKVAAGWLRTKLADKDDLIRDLVAQTMVERNVKEDEAVAIVDAEQHVNGFKRDHDRGGELYWEGRCLKAALKEAVSITVNAGHLSAKNVWGKPDNKAFLKGVRNWWPEHVFVEEDRLYLGVTAPTGISQRFVHTNGPQGRRSAIQYEEYIEDATVDFTVISDFDIPEEQWAAIWLTGEQNGVGASRSQGFGRYTVTGWERA